MYKHRKLLIVTLFVLVAATVTGLILYRRASRPPEPALLLPEGDLLLYVNLKPAHLFGLGKNVSVSDDPEYRDFVRETGFQFERDLDEAAVSQRSPGSDVNTDSSEVFVGRFDQQRLSAYLQKLAKGTERYADKTIYEIPHEGHIVRVAILAPNQVAVTNIASAEPMHGIIDRSRNPKLAGHGAYLLENYHPHVPLTSLAWLIYRTPANSGTPQLPGGFSFDFLQDTVTVASLRYTGSLQLKAEIFAKNEAAATDVADSANTFLVMYQSVTRSVGAKGTDPDVKAVIDSIRIAHENSKAVVTATVPEGFLKKAFSDVAPGSDANRKR